VELEEKKPLIFWSHRWIGTDDLLITNKREALTMAHDPEKRSANSAKRSGWLFIVVHSFSASYGTK
jgi:hypothetical protein